MKPESSPSVHTAYRPALDGLRAVAILSVLGFHAFPAWVPGGFVGVDIFFVISGYLISAILLGDLATGIFSLRDFYARRVRRIFPALLLVLAAVLAFGFFVLWPGEYRQLGKHAAGGAGFIVNLLLQQETGYFDGNIDSKPLLHLWSLGVEEQFYIFWPLMLWAAWKFKHRAGWVIACVIAASFAVNLWLAKTNIVADFYSPLSRFWELLVGGALAWGEGRGLVKIPKPVIRDFMAICGATLLVVADFVLNKNMLFPGWLALAPVCGAVLLIGAGETTFVARKILAHPKMIGIGLISYPLYLWHWPLLSYAQIMVGEASPRMVRAGMMILAFILAALTYTYIERPIRAQGMKKGMIVRLAGLMAGVGVLSLVIFIGKGLPARFTDPCYVMSALDSDQLIGRWQQDVRMGQCHLQEASDVRQGDDCIDAQRPLLWLWGDSHAASLYPGLKELQKTHAFGIAQMTQAACPPLFDLAEHHFRENCNATNNDILAQAVELKPAVILLDSAWVHKDYDMKNAEIIGRIGKTVVQIRSELPQTKIIVVGPLPRWLSPLPAIYRRSLTFTHAPPPMRMDTHLDPRLAALDREMRTTFAAAHITYISPQDYLCDAAGCLTRLDPRSGTPTFIDDEHVSAATAAFLADKFAPDIMEGLGLPN
jgi:peptidoglycan/LPS O-acetylase OafA/YrhL